jgi:transmembrane sensor
VNEEGDASVSGVDRWDEALTWYSTLRDARGKDLTGAMGRKWQQWYSHEENQQVFDAVSRLLERHDVYSKRARQGKAELEKDCYDLSVPIAEWREQQTSREPEKWRFPSRKLGLWLPAGIGTAAITVLLLLLSLRTWSGGDQANSMVYQTAVGGLNDVHLSDGSTIILGGLTKVSVEFSTKRRLVTLINGQGWFKVQHDVRWPFVVSAGSGKIADVGTAFLVTRRSDRVVVTVTEGTVEVSAQPSIWSRIRLNEEISLRPDIVSTRLNSGEQLTVWDNGSVSGAKPTDTQAATAWTDGRLVFEDQPLQYVIETIRRYSSQRIILSAAAGRLRLSGIVFDNDIRRWLQSLEVIFPVTVREQGNSLSIQMRDSMRSSASFPKRRTGK